MPTASPTDPQLQLPAAEEQLTGKAPFESWGRYPNYNAKILPLHWQSDFPAITAGLHNGALPVGMGRSYGDVCLLKDGNLLLTTGMDRLIDFDPETGLLTAEAGITLAQILDFAVPRGFFLPVSPGTKYVTLGGAIANDIHGKNHHTAGTFARGIFMQGDHSARRDDLKPSTKPKLIFPFNAPAFALNHLSVSLFNTVYFHKQIRKRVVSLQDYEPFFYPLDKILHWNRMYGRRGLLQFQYVIPWAHAKEGTIAILHEVAKSGLASFLAVLKVFGDVPSPGMMSFPKPGITVALDFPIKPDRTFPLVARLADMTLEFGGRLYPAKDAAMTAPQFQSFYPQWQQFARFRDPMLTSSFWERVAPNL